VRIVHRLSLLVVLALTFIFAEPAWITSVGSCGYGYNSPYYYPPTQAEFEQHMWDIEAYRFLYCDDGGYYPYGVPANEQPSYSTPAFNQSRSNGSATYWLDEANVSYLMGSYAQAAESYAKAVNLNPSLSVGWLNLGNSLYFLGKYQASLNAYDTLLNLEPQNANALAGKSQALRKIEENNTRP
jgi:tetratricopeptide (TPR) repeat protein